MACGNVLERCTMCYHLSRRKVAKAGKMISMKVREQHAPDIANYKT